jgi:pimeloyl-ACP methyl ester carboxylesterase
MRDYVLELRKCQQLSHYKDPAMPIPLLYLIAAVVLLVISMFALDRLAPAAATRLGLALERRLSGLRLARFASGGISMPYLEGGSGETIVLVHGFGGDKDNFTRTARHLAKSYRVLIPDLPGFGDASRDPGAGYAIADQVENLRLFLQAQGVARVHLGGNSMGGFIVAEFAARYPAQAASLWLLDAAGTAAAFDTPMVDSYRQGGGMPLLLRSPDDFGPMLRACTFRPPLVPHSVKQVLGRRGAADFDLHTSIMRQVHQSPLLEHQFTAIASPALIVWGEQDRVLNPAGAAALQAIMADSEVVTMPNIGHLPMLEAPRRTAEIYLAFLRRLKPA